MTWLRILVLGLALLLLTPSPSPADVLPPSLGSMKLQGWKKGEEARKEIDRLHGKPIPYQKGYIGTYRGKKGEAKVWASEYEAADKAASAIGKMARRLKEEKAGGFWHYRETVIEGMPVYFVLGMGQVHYFWQKGIKVIWLAVDPDVADQTIREAVKKIP